MFLALLLSILSSAPLHNTSKNCITQEMITHISTDWPVIDVKKKRTGKKDILTVKAHNPSNINPKNIDLEFTVLKEPKSEDVLLLFAKYNNKDTIVIFKIIKSKDDAPICYSRNVESLITMEPLFVIPKVKSPIKGKKK